MVNRLYSEELLQDCQQPVKDNFLNLPFPASDQVVVVNFDLDIPPSMECMPSMTPVHTMDKEVLAEAQFLAQQRKYWPSGFI